MRKTLLLCCSVLLCSWVSSAQAGLVVWDIQSSQSVVRLNVPDQNITVDGTTVNARLRNANNSAWSDAGGRASNVTGTIATNYSESGTSASLSFLQGMHNASAIEFGSFRPNPASWDPVEETYTDTSGAPAAFAAKLRAVALGFITLDLGFLSIRDVSYDLGGTATLSGGGGNFSGGANETQLGIADGLAYIDGLSAAIVGQIVPDIFEEDLGALLGGNLEDNAAGLTITNIGGLDRQLVMEIDIPLAFDVDGTVLNGFINGQIVAIATIPEPASSSLVGLALVFGLIRRRRQTV